MNDCRTCEHRTRCKIDKRIVEYTIPTGNIQVAMLRVGRACPLELGGDEYAFETEMRIAEAART